MSTADDIEVAARASSMAELDLSVRQEPPCALPPAGRSVGRLRAAAARRQRRSRRIRGFPVSERFRRCRRAGHPAKQSRRGGKADHSRPHLRRAAVAGAVPVSPRLRGLVRQCVSWRSSPILACRLQGRRLAQCRRRRRRAVGESARPSSRAEKAEPRGPKRRSDRDSVRERRLAAARRRCHFLPWTASRSAFRTRPPAAPVCSTIWFVFRKSVFSPPDKRGPGSSRNQPGPELGGPSSGLGRRCQGPCGLVKLDKARTK